VEEINKKWMLKSGADFKEFSFIELNTNEIKQLHVNKIEKYIVDKNIEEDPEIKQLVDSYLGRVVFLMLK
jgi:hypothetical protein